MSFNKLVQVFLVMVGIVTSIVILGWLTRSPSISQFFLNPTPMRLSTAVLVGLLALSLHLFSLRRDRVALNLCGLIFVCAAAMLVGYIHPFGAWMNSLFSPLWGGFGASFAQRSSLQSSVCLLLLSCGLALSGRSLIGAFAGLSLNALATCISGLEIAGYIFQLNPDFIWGAQGRMSLQGALLLGILSLIAIYLCDCRLRSQARGFRLATFSMMGILILSSLLTQLMAESYVQKAKTVVRLRTEEAAQNIANSLTAEEKSFLRMVKRWNSGTYRSEKNWREDAKNYLEDFQNFENVAWIDRDNHVRYIYPLEGNEAVRHANLSEYPAVLKNIETAKESTGVYITPGRELLIGGRGFAMFYPLVKNEKYDGLMTVGFRFQKLFLQLPQIPGFTFQVFEDKKLLYNSGKADPALSARWAVAQDIDLFNQKWTLVLSPTLETINQQATHLPMLILLVGLFIALLVGAAILFYGRVRETEKRAFAAFEWQKTVAESSPFLIISTDAEANIRSFNRAAEKLLGYRAEEIVNRETALLWHLPEDFEELHRHIEKTMRGPTEPREWTFLAKDGRRFQCVTALNPIFNDAKELMGFVGISEDVTERKKQEEKMITSARLASLGEMAAGIAHEINNPLTIIAAQAANLKKLNLNFEHNAEAIQQKLEGIEKMVHRIADIIRGLKSFSRDSTQDEMRRVRLMETLEETLGFCSQRFKNSGVNLVVSGEATLVVRGKAAQISQIILNLLNNAYDAVKTSAEKKVEILIKTANGMAEISVVDSGPGVPPSFQDKIMQPFFTTKEVGEGLGLGLSISRGIAHAHGGELVLTSSGSPTCFTLRLPLV